MFRWSDAIVLCSDDQTRSSFSSPAPALFGVWCGTTAACLRNYNTLSELPIWAASVTWRQLTRQTGSLERTRGFGLFPALKLGGAIPWKRMANSRDSTSRTGCLASEGSIIWLLTIWTTSDDWWCKQMLWALSSRSMFTAENSTTSLIFFKKKYYGKLVCHRSISSLSSFESRSILLTSNDMILARHRGSWD